MFVGLNTEDVAERWAVKNKFVARFFMALAGFCKNRPYFFMPKGFRYYTKTALKQRKNLQNNKI